MNTCGQLSPRNGSSHLTQDVTADHARSCKRRSPTENMRPFKKARHASQIKNYEFTINRMRERAQQELSSSEEVIRRSDINPQTPNFRNDTNAPPPHPPQMAPDGQYEDFIHQQQMAILNAQSHHLSSPTNLGDISVLQQQQMEIVRSGLPNDATIGMPHFVNRDQTAQHVYPNTGNFGVLQWHTTQLAKNFLGPNAVNRMLEHLASSHEVDHNNRLYNGDEEPEQELRQKEPPTTHHLYDNLECGSTSEECETSDEESDDVRGEEFYVDSAVQLQMCDNSLAFHQQLALAHMHNFRLQAAKASAELQVSTPPTDTYIDDKNAQGFCDEGCDRKPDQVNITRSRRDIGERAGDGKKIYCNLKCDYNCVCKMPPLPAGKETKSSSETVIKGKVESVVENASKANAKFTGSSISNITLPIKTDIAYPKA